MEIDQHTQQGRYEHMKKLPFSYLCPFFSFSFNKKIKKHMRMRMRMRTRMKILPSVIVLYYVVRTSYVWWWIRIKTKNSEESSALLLLYIMIFGCWPPKAPQQNTSYWEYHRDRRSPRNNAVIDHANIGTAPPCPPKQADIHGTTWTESRSYTQQSQDNTEIAICVNTHIVCIV